MCFLAIFEYFLRAFFGFFNVFLHFFAKSYKKLQKIGLDWKFSPEGSALRFDWAFEIGFELGSFFWESWFFGRGWGKLGSFCIICIS